MHPSDQEREPVQKDSVWCNQLSNILVGDLATSSEPPRRTLKLKSGVVEQKVAKEPKSTMPVKGLIIQPLLLSSTPDNVASRSGHFSPVVSVVSGSDPPF